MHKAYHYDRLADKGYAKANKIIRDLTDRGYNVKTDENAFKRKGMSFTDFAVLQNNGFLVYRNYKKLNNNVNKYRI